MSINKNVVFRVDSSHEIGNGHLIRCIAIAQRLKKLKYSINFICSNFDGNQNKLIIKNNYNLNLFAVEKKFQSKGFGTLFLKRVFKKIKNKTKYITVETIDFKATKFYKHKHMFKIIGKRIRFPNSQQVLLKRII